MRKKMLLQFLPLVFPAVLTIGCGENPIVETTEQTSITGAVPAELVDVRVNKLYLWLNPRPDHMDGINRDENPPNFNYIGVNWYILPNNSGLGDLSYYRLSGNGEHMPSTTAGEGGYNTDATLGRIFNNSDLAKGIFPIYRWRLDFPGGVNHTISSYFRDPTGGYVREGILGYAWAAGSINRIYGDSIQSSQIDDMTVNGITIGSTTLWGGACVKLVKNGKEYINRFDAGREIQSTFEHLIRVRADGTREISNPTEGGDMFGNGSPIVNYEVNASASKVFTRSNALRWGAYPPNNVIDPLDPTFQNPIVSGDIIGKEMIVESATRIKFTRWYTPAKSYASSDQKNINTNLFLVADMDSIKVDVWSSSKRMYVNKSKIDLRNQKVKCQSDSSLVDNRKGYIMAFKKDKSKCLAFFNPSMRYNTSDTISYTNYGNLGMGTGSDKPNEDPNIWIQMNEKLNGSISKGGEPRKKKYYILIGTVSEVKSAIAQL